MDEKLKEHLESLSSAVDEPTRKLVAEAFAAAWRDAYEQARVDYQSDF